MTWPLLVQADPAAVHQGVESGVDWTVPLTTQPGDAVRGRAIVASRQSGLCLLCHSGPFPEVRFQGNLAPELTGIAQRLSVSMLRARIADARRLNPETIMPPYFRTDGLARVAGSFAGQTLLNAQQIEDVITYLQSLKTQAKPTEAF
ncbi:MAG: sulfur oxidation c-type cytochrome SoxX [Betaproteobacteria bacterium]|nr:sulfur oxidation c-type cytochrome SoxX [Betaproteobacteria bacterium]